MMCVGVDVHKMVCRAAVVSDEGELVDEFMFRNSSRGIEDFVMKLEVFRGEVLVAVESTANLWIRLYDALSAAIGGWFLGLVWLLASVSPVTGLWSVGSPGRGTDLSAGFWFRLLRLPG